MGEMLDARAFINAMAGLHATGGSTNHLIHLVAMGRAAGYRITWEDFADLAKVVPLLARIYPNGSADVNQFQAAGGLAFVARELIAAGLLFEDVPTLAGQGLSAYAKEPVLEAGGSSGVSRPRFRPRRPSCAGWTIPSRRRWPRARHRAVGRAIVKTSAGGGGQAIGDSTCACLREPRSLPGRFQGECDYRRRGDRRAQSGPESQWHAGTAFPHAHARRVCRIAA